MQGLGLILVKMHFISTCIMYGAICVATVSGIPIKASKAVPTTGHISPYLANNLKVPPLRAMNAPRLSHLRVSAKPDISIQPSSVQLFSQDLYSKLGPALSSGTIPRSSSETNYIGTPSLLYTSYGVSHTSTDRLSLFVKTRVSESSLYSWSPTNNMNNVTNRHGSYRSPDIASSAMPPLQSSESANKTLHTEPMHVIEYSKMLQNDSDFESRSDLYPFVSHSNNTIDLSTFVPRSLLLSIVTPTLFHTPGSLSDSALETSSLSSGHALFKSNLLSGRTVSDKSFSSFYSTVQQFSTQNNSVQSDLSNSIITPKILSGMISTLIVPVFKSDIGTMYSKNENATLQASLSQFLATELLSPSIAQLSNTIYENSITSQKQSQLQSSKEEQFLIISDSNRSYITTLTSISSPGVHTQSILAPSIISSSVFNSSLLRPISTPIIGVSTSTSATYISSVSSFASTTPDSGVPTSTRSKPGTGASTLASNTHGSGASTSTSTIPGFGVSTFLSTTHIFSGSTYSGITASSIKSTYSDTISSTGSTCLQLTSLFPKIIEIDESEPVGTILASMPTVQTTGNVSFTVEVTEPPELTNIMKGYFGVQTSVSEYSLTLLKPVDVEHLYYSTGKTVQVKDILVKVHCIEDYQNIATYMQHRLNVTLMRHCSDVMLPLGKQAFEETMSINMTIWDQDDEMPRFLNQDDDAKCVVPVFKADASEDYMGELTVKPGRITAVDGDLFVQHNISYSVMHAEPEDYDTYFFLNEIDGSVNKTKLMNASDPRKYVLFVQAIEDSPKQKKKVAVLSIEVFAPSDPLDKDQFGVDPTVQLSLKVISALVIIGFAMGFVVVAHHRWRRKKGRVNPGEREPYEVAREMKLPELAVYCSSTSSLECEPMDSDQIKTSCVPSTSSPSQVQVIPRLSVYHSCRKKRKTIIKKPIDTKLRPGWNAPTPKKKPVVYSPYKSVNTQ